MEDNYIAFEDSTLIAQGTQLEVALKIKKRLLKDEGIMILIFNERTGKQIDLNLRGSTADIQKRFTPKNEKEEDDLPKVGRPKLGVVSKEISLLPRHWEWLASQPTSASVTLRRLVDESQKRNKDVDAIRLSQNATYCFMSTMVGDLVGYEEALRALYAREEKTFNNYLTAWPKDIREQIKKFASGVFHRK
ncbi:MAG: DUF2239 family protein [Oligoflexia bacterium]|nr:DUF2239 family protein [Oligoflexia bacterium]